MDYNIILPSRPRVVFEEGKKGIYEIDGLYAGYGHTLGNSLRRIILSSIPGAAITSVKINGANHEFSVIDGVKEDVINIILNLKRIRFKMHSDDPQRATLSIRGIKEGKSKDIKCPTQLEILNEDLYIATLTDKNAKLDIEMTVEKGLGFMSRENFHKEKVDVGMIVLDAIFTPIRRVNYEVENMRVGDRTDYNRLRISIETDDTISPKEALEKSIDIMIGHLKAIKGFQKEEELIEEMEETKDQTKEKEEEKTESSKENLESLKTRIEDINLSSRTLNSLTGAGIRTVGGLTRKKEDDLLQVEGIGKKAIQEIKRALGNLGLTLK